MISSNKGSDLKPFFKKQNVEAQAVIDILQDVVPISGGPDLLEEERVIKQADLKRFLKKNQNLFGQLLMFDRERMSSEHLIEEIEGAMVSSQMEDIIVNVIRSLVYLNIPLDKFLNLKSRKK